jgi:hypothetical protein
MRRLLLPVVVTLVLVGSAGGASASWTPARTSPRVAPIILNPLFPPSSVTLPAGAKIVFRSGWNALTRSEVHSFLDNTTRTLAFGHRVLREDISPIIVALPPATGYTVYFESRTGPLRPGTYKLVYTVIYNQAVFDGTSTKCQGCVDYGQTTVTVNP